jgi:hypothetical protein
VNFSKRASSANSLTQKLRSVGKILAQEPEFLVEVLVKEPSSLDHWSPTSSGGINGHKQHFFSIPSANKRHLRRFKNAAPSDELHSPKISEPVNAEPEQLGRGGYGAIVF